MSLILLLVLGTGEACAANPLNAARLVIAHDYADWLPKSAAAWFAADPARAQAVKLAACEALDKAVYVPWDTGGFFDADTVHGVLGHAWGYRHGLLTQTGTPTPQLLRRRAMKGQ